ncbi:endospore germination permease [Pontibacillus sp. HMF3514]|uniref:GerAB/ArcD/ProY family transporter n=1 Tax=Pontibacillus sp. HMF3514 TaxID=2692425 RepID=UPI00131FA379|nr:endospore germination permease [Pontibacillus sp. HMF3514]QHE51255.1 endospore germination permease [Pontibacillus sp. HMF3514]
MKHTITHIQLFFITTNFIIGSSLLLAPITTGSVAYEDAWLSMILAVIAGLLFNLLILYLIKKNNYCSLFEIVDHAFGKWAGTIINFIIILFTIHLCALVVGNTDDFMVVIKPDTSPQFYQTLMIALAMYSAVSGLKSLGKTNETMSILLYFAFAVSFILLLPNVDMNYFKPFLYRGWVPVIQGGYNTLGVPFLELILLSTLFTFVQDKRKIKTAYISGLLVGGGVLIAFVAFAIGAEGSYMIQRETYPTYALMRDIHFTAVFQRIEILIGIVWIFVLFAKIAVLFIIVMLGIQHLGRTLGYNAYIVPMAIIIWTVCNLTHENIIENTDFVGKSWTLYSFSIYLMAIFSMVVGFIRGKNSGGLDS